jgi:uncharacterized protein (TIGR02996 family)
VTDPLAQILADPDDDRPRLVYADALMERGDPRGELIAVQCALARHDATDDDVGDVPRLRVRERALLAEHGRRWTSEAGLADWQGRFRRGFIEEVSFSAGETFVAQAELLWAKAPLVRALRVGIGLADVAAWRGATRLVSLHGEPAGAAAVGTSPHTSGLRRFGVHGVTGPPELRAIATLPQPLVELDLVFHERAPGIALLGRLVDCPARAHLESLRLVRVRDQEYARLASLPALSAISLAYHDLGAADVVALATPRLAVIDLARAIAREPLALDLAALLAAAPNLRRLRLSRMYVTDAQAIAIAGTPNRLRHLDLGRNAIGDTGALAIARSEHLRGLRHLNLNANRIGDLARSALKDAFPHTQLLLR